MSDLNWKAPGFRCPWYRIRRNPCMMVVTGTTPGVNVLGVQIPLNPDLYTNFTIGSVFLPPFTNFRYCLIAENHIFGDANLHNFLNTQPRRRRKPFHSLQGGAQSCK